MINHKTYLVLAVIVVLNIITFPTIRESVANPLNKGDIIYYIADNKLYRIVMPKNDHADEIFKVPDEKVGESNEINWLSCGMDDTLLFHWTRTTSPVPDYSKAESKTTIILYNTVTKNHKTLVDLNEISTAFPALSPDGRKLSMNAWDKKHKDRFFIVKDLKNNSIKYLHKFNMSSPLTSWSPDNKWLFLVGLDKKNETSQIFILDIEKSELTPWMIGKSPVFSPNGKRIAYVSSDQQKLMIADIGGKTTQSFDGYLFKDLNSWIGEDKILFTIGHFMYQNHIGIADLKEKMIYDVSIPTKSEISGLCYKPGGK